jgi:hypothetical protein
MVRGKYLLGILESQEKIEYLPIIIDLKKGKHGKNLINFFPARHINQFL